MKDNYDTGTEIDILEYEMEHIIEQKDEAIKEIELKIDAYEKKAQMLRNSLQRYENKLAQLRQHREIAETACHSELLDLHKRIQYLKKECRG